MNSWKRSLYARETIILCGDVHQAGKSDIRHDRDVIFRQFTSSSMVSYPTTDAIFVLFTPLEGVERDLPDDYGFRHYDWINEFNYGLVASITSGGSAIIDEYLVAAGDNDEIENETKDVDFSQILSQNNIAMKNPFQNLALNDSSPKRPNLASLTSNLYIPLSGTFTNVTCSTKLVDIDYSSILSMPNSPTHLIKYA